MLLEYTKILFNKKFIIVVAILLINSYVFASCDKVKMGPIGHNKAQLLADKVLEYLADIDVKVVLIGRSGSNSPDERFYKKIGFWDYTHGALFYKNAQGLWKAHHLINTCRQESDIFVHTMYQFFLDDPYEYRTIVAIPALDLQAALSYLVIEQNLAKNYYDNSPYSLISYPFSLARQNSNEYIIDVLIAALALKDGLVLTTRKDTKEYLLTSPYKQKLSTEAVKVGFFEALAINVDLGPDNVVLDDHSQVEKSSGLYNFVSVGSLIQFLQNIDMLVSVKELALKDITKATDTVY